MTNEEQGASAVGGTSAVSRLLEIAARNADELLDEARAEAASIVAAAQADADRLNGSSKTQAEQTLASASAEADRVLAAARTEAERVHTELERHRATVLGDLVEQQAALEAEVSRLRQLEQDLRDRMRSYLTEQLAQIESTNNPG